MRVQCFSLTVTSLWMRSPALNSTSHSMIGTSVLMRPVIVTNMELNLIIVRCGLELGEAHWNYTGLGHCLNRGSMWKPEPLFNTSCQYTIAVKQPDILLYLQAFHQFWTSLTLQISWFLCFPNDGVKQMKEYITFEHLLLSHLINKQRTWLCAR